MKVYCGKLYANLFAGLHWGHPSTAFSQSYCALGSGEQALVKNNKYKKIKKH